MSAEAPSISRAVAVSLRDAQFMQRDTATVALVKRYAALIDAASETAAAVEVAADLGPKLLAALAALGMTPQSRASSKGGATGAVSPAADALARLRAERAAR